MSATTAAPAWEALFRAQVHLMRHFEAAKDFEPLSAREYDVLFTLSRCGGAARMRDMVPNLLLSQPSLSRMVDRLAADGLLERRVVDGDGRGVVVALTERGAELQRRVGRRHVRSITGMVDGVLTEDEQAQLVRICTKLQRATHEEGSA
ncbi:MarR family winged helix-turn-helix transcriptional regulator [Ruania alba]|uniref:DNA-binding transcriptional regulator, MarR family n=1 Tax=Ruania alba TaxID=648782 RepID=A0A1H5F293_9MICO|nr:MarR family transcriptional regulator [Ruania alba]SED97440.1 DNA-binding transcriptional regulator, MarR family [Ruania alba]